MRDHVERNIRYKILIDSILRGHDIFPSQSKPKKFKKKMVEVLTYVKKFFLMYQIAIRYDLYFFAKRTALVLPII